ncbi:MAG: hypothetical protein Q9182_005534 [Xanthomendoza sp. 2 TL-2023]
MPLSLGIHPCGPEDLRTCSSIQWQASATNPLWQLIFPGGGTRALLDNIAHHMQREFDDPAVRFYKVIDTLNPGKIIACAKWTVVKSQPEPMRRNQDIPVTSNPPQVPGEDANEALFNAFTSEATPIREAHLNGPTIVLDDLSVDSAHQRQGAGKLLLEALISFADEHGLPCYVESTPAVRDMYIHQGFREVDNLEIDLGRWKPGCGVYQTAMLYRDAQRRGEE